MRPGIKSSGLTGPRDCRYRPGRISANRRICRAKIGTCFGAWDGVATWAMGAGAGAGADNGARETDSDPRTDRIGKTGSGSRTAAELAAEIVQEPAAWSAGALLRPVVQDMALPVCSYVGGWGELAYHAQLGRLREATGVTEVAFIPRLSVTLSDPDIRASLEVLGCSAADILAACGEK